MAKPLLSFVIPCYRSAHTIGAVVRELNDTLAARADEYDHEIILVNDGSPDDTADAIDGLKINEFNSETPSKKQEAAFTVHLDNDSYPTLTVTLYQYDGENCLAQLDGTTLGLISRSLVVDLTEAVNAITLGLA